jgi:outer membrane protein assembly factor BamA
MLYRHIASLLRPVLIAGLALVPALPATLLGQEIDCDTKTEKEVRSLAFEGNRTFGDGELSARVLTTPSSLTRRYVRVIGTRRCFPDVGLAPDSSALKQFYHNNGFYDTRVTPIVRTLSPSEVAVTFRIDEGQPIRLDTLRITGLESVRNRDDARRDLHLQVGGRFGLIPMYMDIDTLRARLRNLGYPRVEVFPSVVVNYAEHRASVEFEITTGPLSHFGTIAISRVSVGAGEAQIDSSTVLRLLGFRSGETYSDRALADAQRNLYNLGAFRHVGIATDTTAVHGDSVTDISVDVREDYMKQLDLEEGWATLDCFRVNSQYTDKNAFDNGTRVELTGRVSKLGYGAPTSSMATRNLCYRSKLDEDSIASSKVNYYAGATIREPTLFGTHWVPAYSLFTERRGEYKAFLRTTMVGFEASATRTLGLGIPFRVGYTLEYGQTAAERAVLCGVFNRCELDSQEQVQRRLRFAVASAAIQRVRTDNVVDPANGYSLGAELRGGAPVIGSDPTLSFIKSTADASWYHSFPGRSVFAARLRGGFIRGGATEGSAKLPPPQERLYAGGANSVRGFGQNELGPLVYLVDTAAFTVTPVNDTVSTYVLKPGATAFRTVPVGGNALLVFNVEVRIRDPFFPEALEYVPFVDGGQVWTRQANQNFGFSNVRVTPGLGVRYFSPVGPIQLNAGYNPYRSEAGAAYFPAPVGFFPKGAPLLCVTPAGVTPLLVRRLSDGSVEQDITNCPRSFTPPPPSNFFQRFKLTLSIGNNF